jgi:surface-anchored protein
MKRFLRLSVLLAAFASRSQAGAQCHTFTHEHVDLLSIQWISSSNTLSLMAADDDHGALYASNQCVVVCPESMKFALPAGTPLGNEGESLWILPQNPYDNVPYAGVSAESISPGNFNDPFTIRLTRLEGPGQFLLWQAGAFGDFDLKMDTRDGISGADALAVTAGGHAHYNWGFTTSGVYRLYFQAAGVRAGQTNITFSPETPFTFHILPLRPFENWVATNWPCECATNVIAPGADPDGDGRANALEYATGDNPHLALYSNAPAVTFLTVDGTNYGALRYVRATSAPDVSFDVRAASSLNGTGESLTNVASVVPHGDTEVVTVRDSAPIVGVTSRFFQFRVQISPP